MRFEGHLILDSCPARNCALAEGNGAREKSEGEWVGEREGEEIILYKLNEYSRFKKNDNIFYAKAIAFVGECTGKERRKKRSLVSILHNNNSFSVAKHFFSFSF